MDFKLPAVFNGAEIRKTLEKPLSKSKDKDKNKAMVKLLEQLISQVEEIEKYIDGGASLLPLACGEKVPWRSELLYEYYWERNYPQTPTVHTLREQRYKYMHFHGIWDIDELYDLAQDPREADNLLARPGHEQIAERMSSKLFDILERTNGMQIPLGRDAGERNILRDPDHGRGAPFPPTFFRTRAK